ncbi:hypothetical protein [Rummeliibacillus sp. TYF-LIM-RU47]|uniref:hypothetical protein n=1 Tax=Rummeliibacillus sp. TYF-LIM-RU47 TaxID=2608406 RepID=UPI00123A9164|nr:hypothetical protein [Rummeliibacillus sp. TYF-LIM-RU47]
MKKDDVIAGLIVIVGILTLLLTWILISQHFIKENDTFIAGISLVGAILGGVISGGLTLIGVKMTISENNKYDEIKKIPNRFEDADYLVKCLKSLLVQSLGNQDDQIKSNKTARELQNILDSKNLIVKSINVNYETYLDIRHLREILMFSRLPSQDNVSDEKTYGMIDAQILKCISQIEKEIDKMIEYITESTH